MKDILERIADSSPNESSHELICRLRDCANEIEKLRDLRPTPAAYADLQGLRDALLAPREIVRDTDGFLTHPAFPLCDEDVRADKLLAAFGMDAVFVSMECDDSAAYDRYSDGAEGGFADWNPTVPEGDGWVPLEIYDTEDGPYALFARRTVEETNRQRRAREDAEAIAAASTEVAMTQAVHDVLAERYRQITEKGHTVDDDLIYNDQGQMSYAAAGLAALASEAATDIVCGLTGGLTYADECIGEPEPWPHGWKYKPATPRRNLVVAGAFVLAEIERIDHATADQPDASES